MNTQMKSIGPLKLKFLGALEQVTGSSTLLEMEDLQILVDFGYEQGENPTINLDPFDSIDFKKLKAVFLTHSHLDHCGMIPLLYKRGYQGKVFTTKATAELAPHILRDCSRLGGAYTESDIDLIQWFWPDMSSDFEWQKEIPLTSTGLNYYFQPTGHILGAVSIGFVWPAGDQDKKFDLLFSGDLGYNFNDQTANILNPQTMMPRETVTHIVCESTYGDRVRSHGEKDFKERINRLKGVLNDTVMSKSCLLLIPSFSMHRTQEMILDLYFAAKSIDKPVYNPSANSTVASPYIKVNISTPLGDRISSIYSKRLTDFIGPKLGNYKNISREILDWSGLTYKEVHKFIRSLFSYAEIDDDGADLKGKAMKSLDRKGYTDEVIDLKVWKMNGQVRHHNFNKSSQVVIASSGMMDNGPMKSWIAGIIDDPNTYIAITGYQALGTIGQRLIDMKLHGNDNHISLGDTIYTKEDIKCNLVDLRGYSGHADQGDLIKWASANTSDYIDRLLILNHGTNEMRDNLKNEWNARTGMDAIIPMRNCQSVVIE
jgi:metallo-beta-lactamase family protein